ncbi:MAG TPA: fimbria/pilus periplasmic chaperone [Steroidobacteraceae bacterium]|jgi:fimbrial chaperone protein
MIDKSKVGRALAGLAALMALVPATAEAGSFSVNPVRLTLSAKESVGAITVTNQGAEPTVVQLETFSWSQHEGQDSLTPTNDVLATPPILTIPPGGSKIVRVGLRRPADPQHELTYRLALREIPPAEPLKQALRVTLLISMPIFIDPPRAVAAVVHWRATRAPGNKIRLRVKNTGTAHIQMGQLEIVRADNGKPVATRNSADYVLPDDTREWLVDAPGPVAPGTLMRIRSVTDSGKASYETKLEEE